ncbi:MAG: thioredoxin family protein [Lentisphaeria bacterium]|nr:thioredoxin family protein [Lentisphaeria bacterium]
MEVVHLNEDSLKKLLSQQEKAVLVDFWAQWCSPCCRLAPVLEDFAAKHPDIIVGKVDVDEYPHLAAEWNVDTIPALFFIRAGKVEKRLGGLMSCDALEANLGL